MRSDRLEHVLALLLRLAYRETADGVAIETDLPQSGD